MKKIAFIISYFGGIASQSIKRQFFFIALTSFLSTIIISFQPVIMAKLVSVIEQPDSDLSVALSVLALSYIVLMCLRKLSSAVIIIMMISLRNKLVIMLSDHYLKNIFHGYKIKENENTGDITQRLNQASDELSTVLRNTVHNFLPPLLQLIFSIIVIIWYESYVVAILFCIYFGLYFLVKNKFNSQIVMLYNDFYGTSVKKYSVITDSIKNIGTARACNSYPFLFARYEALLNTIEGKHASLLREDVKFLVAESCLNVLFFGAAFLFSLYQALHQQISLGHFVMISSYIILLSGPLESIGAMYTALMKSTESLNGFIKDIRLPREHVFSEHPQAGESVALTLSDVTFHYQGAASPTIKHFSLNIFGPGFITLTGTSGSGKSTLAKLIAGEINPTAGSIRINGRDLRNMTAEDLAGTLYHVSQNDGIFMDTLRFNLQIACPGASDPQLIDALNFARLDDLQYDEGTDILDMVIGDGGLTLSGGQRQRLSLARLFLREPNIIILDEVTSALDVINEVKVIENIKSRFPTAIILSISHRYTTFHFSDEILVLSREGLADRGGLTVLRERCSYIRSVMQNAADAEAAAV
ncbi:ATP-binding cassette domain-containing protein [Samsonia erythrinae]|uniref:ATP-binding cassette subfamily B protein n=1 Tax=Samsonia erythrinae TaxID=160434 RepID=A0A4R3VJR1_9GAMM|nr:ATP-binding cassette domain-containing protein [Samsonia erythrinae]TCV04078.1 ATP-binding cassette subfamily B protein [Samsonia erythrinae]